MIGVLALQGAFAPHVECLMKVGVKTLLVKTLKDLEKVDALVLPGGETTAHLKLMDETFFLALQSFCQTQPVFGTCCGLILLSKGIVGESRKTFGVLDVQVKRNAYGPQIASFEAKVDVSLNDPVKVNGCFIRAPQIVEVGPKVSILASYDHIPVLVQQKNILACSFHPEVVRDTTLHQFFADEMVRKKALV